MPKNTILLDGDYIVFKSCAGKDEFPLDEVTDLLDESMHYILANCQEAFGGEEIEYISFLSGKGNKRKIAYPDYKANRKGKPMPVHLQAVRLHLSAFWNGVTVNGIEADDAIGICAYYLPTENTIIGTADKDFAQMRNVWIYDLYPRRAECPRKDVYIEKELTEDGVWYRTSEESGLKQLTYQLIYGDAGDNIKGIPSYNGKKRGHKKTALEHAFNMIDGDWQAITVVETVKDIYKDQFGKNEGMEMFNKVYDLVHIERLYCDEFKEIPKMQIYGA
jgi:5'-3' exonuclease